MEVSSCTQTENISNLYLLQLEHKIPPFVLVSRVNFLIVSEGRLIITDGNKKVLLHERKRHTARRVASARVGRRVPTLDRGMGYLPWRGEGVPTLDGEGYLPWATPSPQM